MTDQIGFIAVLCAFAFGVFSLSILFIFIGIEGNETRNE